MSTIGAVAVAPLSTARGAGAAAVRGVRVAASTVLTLTRWIAMHWLWSTLGVLAVLIGCTAHRPFTAAAGLAWVLVPAVVSMRWLAASSASYERWCAAPWRQWTWRTRHHLTWARTSQALGLGRTRTRTRRTRDGGRRTEQVWKPTRCRVRTTALGMSLEVSTPLGSSVDKVLATADALAAASRATSVRARRMSPSLGCFDLTMVDALGVPRLSADPATTGLVVLGRCEDGTELTWDPTGDAHGAFQGMTRSGKSALSYTLLSALAARGDVLVCGVDPSGILDWTKTDRKRTHFQELVHFQAHIQL